MKVKAIIKYHDTLLKRDINIGDKFEVKNEERLKQLLGNNKNKIVCVEEIVEKEIPTLEDTYPTDKLVTDNLPADKVCVDELPKEAVENKAKGKTKNAKRK